MVGAWRTLFQKKIVLYYVPFSVKWSTTYVLFWRQNSFCTHSTLETSFFEAKVGTIVLNRRNSAFRAYLRYFLTTFWPACNCWRSICLLCDLGGVRSSWSLFHFVTLTSSVSHSDVTMSLVSHWKEGPLFPPGLPTIGTDEEEGVLEVMPPPGSL